MKKNNSQNIVEENPNEVMIQDLIVKEHSLNLFINTLANNIYNDFQLHQFNTEDVIVFTKQLMDVGVIDNYLVNANNFIKNFQISMVN